MLRKLRVKNFALINQVEIEFSEGLNILSGETGAEKSIELVRMEFKVHVNRNGN